MRDILRIQEGTSLEELAGEDLINSPINVIVGTREGLLREVYPDQAELLTRRGGLPALGYLELDEYKVVDTRIRVPDESYVYEKGSRFDQQLEDVGIL